MTYNWCQHAHACRTRRLDRDAGAFTRPAVPSLNTVTLSHQHASSCNTNAATALIVRMRM